MNFNSVKQYILSNPIYFVVIVVGLILIFAGFGTIGGPLASFSAGLLIGRALRARHERRKGDH